MFTTRTLLEGKWVILVLLAFGIAGLLYCWPVAVISFALLAFTFSFFRDPCRTSPADPNVIVSPADGRIVEVRPAAEPHYLKGDATMVAIFLSVFDVHVQRAPLAGVIKFVKYNPGQFLDARNAQASALKESRVIGLEAADGLRVTVRQIAGLIARRIVGWADVGATVAQGERIGMIRFGSRVEIFLPPGVEVLVQPGLYAKGGETILARKR
jgi:phosphatidylserine decarboxylase